MYSSPPNGSGKSCMIMLTSSNEGKMLRPPERRTRGSVLECVEADDMVG
jgi:hypothetical protein